MALTGERRYRVVEVLPNSRPRMIDSDLSLQTARSSIALFRQIDPSRQVVIESEDPEDDVDEANGDDLTRIWSARILRDGLAD